MTNDIDPVTIGVAVKRIYPEYADMDDAYVGSRYMLKYGSDAESLRALGMGGLEEESEYVKAIKSGSPIEDIPLAERAGVYAALNEEGVEPQTRKEKAARKQIRGLIDTLAKLKTQTRETGLTDIPFHLVGTNPDIKKFNATKQLATQFIARLVESGRLSDEDRKFYQERVNKLSPYGFQQAKEDTIDSLMEDVIRLSGFQPDEFNISQSEDPSQGDSFSPAEEAVNAVKGAGKFFLGESEEAFRDVAQTSPARARNVANEDLLEQAITIATQAEQTEDPEEKQRLLSESQRLFGQVSGEASSIAGGFSEDVMENPWERGAEVGLEIGSAAELPFLARSAATKIPSVLDDAVKVAKSGRGVVGEAASKIAGAFKSKPAVLTDEALEAGTKAISKGGKIRDIAIKKAQESGLKVDGNTLVKNLEKWAVREKRANPTKIRQVDNFVEGASKRFKGKKLNPRTAKDLWDDASKGFTSANNKGSSLEASYHRAIRDTVRKELDILTKGKFEEGTKIIREGIKEKKLLKGVKDNRTRKEVMKALEEEPSLVQKLMGKPDELVRRAVQAAIGTGGVIAASRAFGKRD